MITRRSFLTALSCLPFAVKLIPQQEAEKWSDYVAHDVPLYPTPGFQPFATMPSNITDMIAVDDHVCVMLNNGRAYVVYQDGSYEEILGQTLPI